MDVWHNVEVIRNRKEGAVAAAGAEGLRRRGQRGPERGGGRMVANGTKKNTKISLFTCLHICT